MSPIIIAVLIVSNPSRPVVLDVYPLEEMVSAEKFLKETPFTTDNIPELRRNSAICRRVRRAFIGEKDGKIPKNCSTTILNRFASLKIPEVVSVLFYNYLSESPPFILNILFFQVEDEFLFLTNVSPSFFVEKWDRVEDNILKEAMAKLNTEVGKSLIVKAEELKAKHGTFVIYFFVH